MTEQTQSAYMFPTSVKEVERLGWDYIDIILFSGDAFIDHPSSGTAMIARVLQREGWRVAVVPQPGWQDDLRDFRKLGVPRLFFGVNSGAMDSMVNLLAQHAVQLTDVHQRILNIPHLGALRRHKVLGAPGGLGDQCHLLPSSFRCVMSGHFH